MNRIEIKKKARKVISGKLWDVFKPLAILFLLSFFIGLFTTDTEEFNVITFFLELLLYPLIIGINSYMLNVVRNKSYNINDIWQHYKNIWSILATIILSTILIFLGYVALIIPGIILSFCYSMIIYIMADGETDPIDTLRKSRELIKGYKMDYFIFIFSFIPWLFLIILTFGIASVYVMPYIFVSNSVYYDELKKLKKKKA